jgi:very-short-patch-repair endonuclease
VLSIIGTRWSKPLPDVVVHRPKRVFPAAVETISGLAVTDRSTTIIDLASVLPAGRFKRVLDDQLSSHQVKLDDVVAAFERQARRGKKGVALARQLIEERLGGLVIAESELEHLFRERIEPHIVISPTYQFRPSWRTEGIGRADVAFPHHLLLAELDGRRWHLRDIDRENDLRRDNEALERDWRTVRYSYRQITKETAWVIQNLGRILELGPKTPPIR